MPAAYLPLFEVIIGIPILAFGRKLFWLFIGTVGFLSGLQLSTRLLPNQEGWLPLIIALGLALIGVGLAILFQKFAVWVIGFLVGAYLAFQLFQIFNIQAGDLLWLFLIIGGVIGAGLTIGIFEWALIFLSSIGGAIIILQGLHRILPIITPTISTILFIILLVSGLFFQSKQKHQE
ncbi:MAG: hypothetical protein JEZ06_19595 [Anaerolineaceae bacterium]|nr:hypothetical protein [Anaerolineaceae bacterium]